MTKYIFGVDIGGTTIKFGLFDQHKALLEKREIPTDIRDAGARICDDIVCLVKQVMNEKQMAMGDVIGLGVGIPGPVSEDGVVHTCVNLGWGRKDVVGELSRKLNLSIKAGNDANVAALGEWKQGGGLDQENMIMVTLGTGVGGGIIQHGKMIAGHHGAAGEIGHLTMNVDEVVACNCGRYGCLEQYASANGLVKYAKQYLLNNPLQASVLRQMKELDAKAIVDAGKQNDEVALACISFIAQLLGRALSQLACVINPDVFVIGGGLSLAGDVLFESIRQHYTANAFPQSRDTAIVPAMLGNDAGIYGCAELF